jgi:hypothetical protein
MCSTCRWAEGWVWAIVFFGLSGCAAEPIQEEPEEPTVRAVFELGPDPMDFGAIPFPDDLYLAGSNGGIALGDFPREEAGDSAMFDSLRAALSELDGFGVNSPVFVHFDGPIDAQSLPQSPDDSLVGDASVFLLEADSASPTAFSRVPVTVRWEPNGARLSIQPADGHVLVEGTRYAAIVTRRVRASDDSAVGPAAEFEAIRDATSRPEDALSAEAYDQYAPVIAGLAARGVQREDVAAMAVFRVQSIRRDLEDARDLVWEGELPPITIRRVITGAEIDALLGVPESAEWVGADAPGGVAHESIAWVIDGTFGSRELASPSPGVHGQWMRAGTNFVVKREDSVWFTLLLPEGAELTNVPVIVFQHGFGGHRADVFSVANTLCAAGFAVAALDLPFHGMRATSTADTRHTYGDGEGPDLYGDTTGLFVAGDFLGIFDQRGELVPFHPFYVRDVFRQSVVDLMTFVRVLEQTDFGMVEEQGGPSFELRDGSVGFLGLSLGGVIGGTFVANEPNVGAALLSVSGGYLSRLVEMSASYGPTFLGTLLPRLGLDYATVDWATHPPSSLPEIAIFQTLLDRADSIAHAPALANQPVNLLLQMATDDETVPNVGTESLAAILDAPIVFGTPMFAPLERATLPLMGNITIGGTSVTRGLVVFEPATHGMLALRYGEFHHAHPVMPPFMSISPVLIENPVAEAQAQMRHFFETWRGGAAEIAAVP